MTEPGGQVQWDKLDQPTFDRFIEPLLTRLQLKENPSAEVDCIDGRGGDSGRDIDVHENDRLTHIYQLKFFPEGFSGAWAKARKPQIRRSFNAAMVHRPDRWTLVVPRNPTTGEREFVKSLKKSHKVSIHVMGRAKLDELMARFPDLLHWATREPLVETLRTVQLERAALAGAADLQEAVEHLQQVADSRSPNWTVNHSYVDGVYTETLVAKHPLAQEREPIGLRSARIEIPSTETELGERANRVFRYGDNEELTLTAEYLKDVDFVAPSWSVLSKPLQSPVLVVPPRHSIREDVHVEFQVVDEEDIVLRSYTGISTHLGKGTEGVTLRARLTGGIDILMLMDLVDDEAEGAAVPGGTITFNHNYVDLPASEAWTGFQFISDLMKSQKIRVLFDNQFVHSFMAGQNSSRTPEETAEYLDGDGPLLVEDLMVLERELTIQFPVPAEISNRDRLVVRVARLLLEGHVVMHPFMDGLNGELSEDIGTATTELIRQGRGAVFADMQRLTMDLLGKKVALGFARFAISYAEIIDSDALVDAITRGDFAGKPFRVRAEGNEGVKVFLPGRVQSQDGELTVSPWGVPGIPEHDELRGISAPPAPDLGDR